MPRLIAATALAFFPIFVANLVFASRFRDTERSTAAFGANLLGAMFGGLLEYVSLVTGYRSLLSSSPGSTAWPSLLRPRAVGGRRLTRDRRLVSRAERRPAGAGGSARSRRRGAGRGPAPRAARRSAGAS